MGEDVPDQAFLHFVFIALGYWGLGVGAEDFWLGLDCMQKESCICRLWASSGHWDKATSARTRRWQFGVNVEKWKIQKRGLLSLAIFSSVWRGSGRNGGRGTGLNTVAFVLELKQQTLPMQTLKKCIKRCNKSESKGGVSGGQKRHSGSGRCKGGWENSRGGDCETQLLQRWFDEHFAGAANVTMSSA